MAITYEYQVVKLKTIDTDDHSKIVKEIDFRYIGTDDTGAKYNVESFITLDTDNIDTFIEYADLTEETVAQWLTDNVHEDQTTDWQGIIENQINAINNKPTTQTQLPWENEA